MGQLETTSFYHQQGYDIGHLTPKPYLVDESHLMVLRYGVIDCEGICQSLSNDQIKINKMLVNV